MFLRLLLLLTLVPVLELWTLFKFHDFLAQNLPGDTAFLSTFGLIIFTGLIGAQLARGQGIKVLAEIKSSLNRGVMPGPAVVDGLFILGGGALLLTPGIWTDLVGLTCLIPTTRNLYRLWLIRQFKDRVTSGTLMYDMDLGKKGNQFRGDLTIDIDPKSDKNKP